MTLEVVCFVGGFIGSISILLMTFLCLTIHQEYTIIKGIRRFKRMIEISFERLGTSWFGSQGSNP